MSDIKRKINSDLDDRMTLDWQGTRAFFYGLGYNDADIEKPRVGIMNTWNEINPGHIHQRHLAAVSYTHLRAHETLRHLV